MPEFQILEQANILLEDVKHYSVGASVEIRIAIQQPNNKDAQRGALDILSKLVMQIRAYYELSQRIEQIIPLLLWDLCSGMLFFCTIRKTILHDFSVNDNVIMGTIRTSVFVECIRIKNSKLDEERKF